VIYSGLDWSGSPGREQGPYLVLAVVHIDEANLPIMETELSGTAHRLRWPPHFVFKHSKAEQRVHTEFYRAVARIPFTAHVHLLDKAAWHNQYGGKGSRGDDCICDGMTTLLVRCPPETTSDTILYIDVPHREKTTMKNYRTIIRSTLIGANRRTFRDIKLRPDSRRDGGLIQVADMLPGEAGEYQGLAGPFLPGLGAKLTIV
jgi:hypothetical protein